MTVRKIDTIPTKADGEAVGSFRYVYVNADGTARELHQNERQFLETEFLPGDGGRPYIKSSYPEKDGWGAISGYLERSELPHGKTVDPAPAEDPIRPRSLKEEIQFWRDKGLAVIENADGTFTIRRP